MTVTAAEFGTNLGKYINLLFNEDIFITQNGRTVAKVTQPHTAVDALSGLLAGHIPNDYDIKNLRNERLAKYAVND